MSSAMERLMADAKYPGVKKISQRPQQRYVKVVLRNTKRFYIPVVATLEQPDRFALHSFQQAQEASDFAGKLSERYAAGGWIDIDLKLAQKARYWQDGPVKVWPRRMWAVRSFIRKWRYFVAVRTLERIGGV